MILNPYEVSESLFQARRNILKYEVDGYFFQPSDIRNLSEYFLIAGISAQQMAHELARFRAVERTEDRYPLVTVLLDEATRPGSNIVLLNLNGDHVKI